MVGYSPLMGITMANMRNLHIKDIIHFKESLSILMISSLFIVLAARIHFTSNFHMVVIAGLLFLVLQFGYAQLPFGFVLKAVNSNGAKKSCYRGFARAVS